MRPKVNMAQHKEAFNNSVQASPMEGTEYEWGVHSQCSRSSAHKKLWACKLSLVFISNVKLL